jgi:hypothetical protein
MSQYCHIMVWPGVSTINVDEKILMIDNDHVVYRINFFPLVEPSLVCHIIPWFVNLYQVSINELDATWEISNRNSQCNPFLYCWPSNLIHNNFIMQWKLYHSTQKTWNNFTWMHHAWSHCHAQVRMKFKRCCFGVNFHGQLKNHTMFHMVDNSWHDYHRQLFEFG